MTETFAAEVTDIKPTSEHDSNLRTKLATAAALGGLGVAAYFAEKYGLVHDNWPPPAHSLKHPWIGYYSAWMADKVFKKFKKTTAITSGVIANTGVKAAQNAVYHPDRSTFFWFHGGHRFELNADLISDYAVCVGAGVLCLAQNQGITNSIRNGASRLFGRSSLGAVNETV